MMTLFLFVTFFVRLWQRAIKNRCKSGSEQREHWLDYADDIYEARTWFLFLR